jgi:ADP-ribose pyrophosphatase YjhB (NUDIX family)
MSAVPGASGGLIIDRAGQVLLVKPNHGEHWGVPGGAMNAGETAVREIGEEVGPAVTLGTLPGRGLDAARTGRGPARA